MPEVKWVKDIALCQNFATCCSVCTGKLIPVLTLDEVEAWLKSQKTDVMKFAEKRGYLLAGFGNDLVNGAIDDLLAQVQAWKEGKA
jgi:phosphosulfolactate phosphohydrolase-like enzyme